MKQIIHVNQHVIKRNTKLGTDEPVLTVKTYRENNYGHEAIIKTKDGCNEKIHGIVNFVPLLAGVVS